MLCSALGSFTSILPADYTSNVCFGWIELILVLVAASVLFHSREIQRKLRLASFPSPDSGGAALISVAENAKRIILIPQNESPCVPARCWVGSGEAGRDR